MENDLKRVGDKKNDYDVTSVWSGCAEPCTLRNVLDDSNEIARVSVRNRSPIQFVYAHDNERYIRAHFKSQEEAVTRDKQRDVLQFADHGGEETFDVEYLHAQFGKKDGAENLDSRVLCIQGRQR